MVNVIIKYKPNYTLDYEVNTVTEALMSIVDVTGKRTAVNEIEEIKIVRDEEAK
jgi:hypothetical protein